MRVKRNRLRKKQRVCMAFLKIQKAMEAMKNVLEMINANPPFSVGGIVFGREFLELEKGEFIIPSPKTPIHIDLSDGMNLFDH